MQVGALNFLSPFFLPVLSLLPLIWALLRVTPPPPARLAFPGMRFLRDLQAAPRQARTTPPWLILLRLLAISLIILGFAHPIWQPQNAEPVPARAGPLWILYDNSWSSAAHWNALQEAAERTLDRARQEHRNVRVWPLAEPAGSLSGLMGPKQARATIKGLDPLPWEADWKAHRETLDKLAATDSEGAGAIIWLSGGLTASKLRSDISRFTARLAFFGPVILSLPELETLPAVLVRPGSRDPGSDPDTLELHAPAVEKPRSFTVRIEKQDGTVLQTLDVRVPAGSRKIGFEPELPASVARQARRVGTGAPGQQTAGSVYLYSGAASNPSIGIVDVENQTGAALLTPQHYISKSFAPGTDLRRAPASDLIQDQVEVIIVANRRGMKSPDWPDLKNWVEKGGVLIRFAGDHITAGPESAPGSSQIDGAALLPAPLRYGGRILDGTLTWSEPMQIASFPETSPLHGLSIPDDIRIRRQVLTEPELLPPESIWARLEDGTPLVTGVRREAGWSILVHTTATPEWSNLAISGLFPDIMARLAGLARLSATQDAAALRADKSLRPRKTLDGRGNLRNPRPEATPIRGTDLLETPLSPRHPPGLYGSAGYQKLRNAGDVIGTPLALQNLDLPQAVNLGSLSEDMRAGTDFQPALFLAALMLFAVDAFILIFMRGHLRLAGSFPGLRHRRALTLAGTGILLGMLALNPATPYAQTSPPPGFSNAAEEVRLGFIRTGQPATDRMSAEGLRALSNAVAAKTATQTGDPQGVTPGKDPLAFYPILYWPVTAGQEAPGESEAGALQSYMQQGGTLVIDRIGEGADSAFRRIAAQLSLPRMQRLPEDHVLTKSFYLLDRFPGARGPAPVWVAESAGTGRDNVSPVIAGRHNWAQMWARAGQSPAGSRDDAEWAQRFGINAILYALTGNYKADQVHVPHILERLGP